MRSRYFLGLWSLHEFQFRHRHSNTTESESTNRLTESGTRQDLNEHFKPKKVPMRSSIVISGDSFGGGQGKTEAFGEDGFVTNVLKDRFQSGFSSISSALYRRCEVTGTGYEGLARLLGCNL